MTRPLRTRIAHCGKACMRAMERAAFFDARGKTAPAQEARSNAAFWSGVAFDQARQLARTRP